MDSMDDTEAVLTQLVSLVDPALLDPTHPAMLDPNQVTEPVITERDSRRLSLRVLQRSLRSAQGRAAKLAHFERLHREGVMHSQQLQGEVEALQVRSPCLVSRTAFP